MDIQHAVMLLPSVAVAAHRDLVARNPDFETQAARLRQVQVANYRQMHLGQNVDLFV